eukprot:CAMPEP_0181252192 /NCGR_PEP_ID=MMETSP1096-20121128/47326_1 /TAXON_ID=156174 ORGANISM="Chrysochromulina ericina, Strain CCMP281" /NCGR_SAMPLE_ID=MMETSP1096 /ASSEMBLY_ACC=CAM_ASM_000453 /LENGTH=152 /DNA_ID=CAMNT_0023349919 /DNA_START=603 /DNA_END=1062 /DNA_ORIENTATION=-
MGAACSLVGRLPTVRLGDLLEEIVRTSLAGHAFDPFIVVNAPSMHAVPRTVANIPDETNPHEWHPMPEIEHDFAATRFNGGFPQELHCWLAMSEHARDEPWLRDDGGVPHRVGLQEPRVRCQLAVVSADDARKVRGALVAEVGLSENLHIVR